MNFLKKLAITTKLHSGFFALGLVIIFITLIGYINMRTIFQSVDEMYKLTEEMRLLGLIEADFYRLSNDTYRFAYLIVQRNKISEDIATDNALITDHTALMSALNLSPDETALVNQFRNDLNQYQSSVNEVISWMKAGNEASAGISLMPGGNLTEAQKSASSSLDSLYNLIQGNAVKGKDHAAQTFRLSIGIMVGSGILGIILALLMGAALSRNISGNIKKIASSAKELADGNLSIRSSIQSGDEIGVLSSSFNRMADRLNDMLLDEQHQRAYLQSAVERYASVMADISHGVLSTRVKLDGNNQNENDPIFVLGQHLNETIDGLQKMITQIHDSSSNLSSASSEILAATTQQVSGASEQSAAISQTTTTVDEVKTLSVQAIERAQEVVSASQRTVDISSSGQHTVNDTVDAMALIKERVEGIAENIVALSEQTQQIGEIIATVNDIASQSNMLALNASIEAARAGEHGKGFAAVALEVRNLAEQSKLATSQVKNILQDIQDAINAAVMATEEGTKVVDAGVKMAARTGEVITQLTSAITDASQTAMQVMAGGRQQASGVEQIALAMQNINQATVQGLSSTRQAEKAAQDLNNLAQELNNIVQKYHV